MTRGACPFRPCCGPAAYAFPELAASNKQLCAQLLAELAERGPAAAMAGMDEQAREGIRAALRGNNRWLLRSEQAAPTQPLHHRLLSIQPSPYP